MPSSPDEWTLAPNWNVSRTTRAIGLPQAAPEGGVEENHVDGVMLDARRELLEIDHHRIGRRRDRDAVTQAPHAFKAEAGILEIVVADVGDLARDADRFFDRPDTVGIEAELVAGEGVRECREHLDVMVGRKHAALQFVRLEPVEPLLPLGLSDNLVGRILVAKTGLFVGHPIE